ncbi:MAG: hypothetical protein IPO21_02525 [Bacteroidales bacterium]|nr:hypothetical protein [Bacteroidales bacterium]
MGNSGIAEGYKFIKAHPKASTQNQKEYFVCSNQKANAEFHFTGTAPWSFRINNVGYKTSNPIYHIDSLLKGKYIISNFSDANCDYQIIDTITVSEYPKVRTEISDNINVMNDSAIYLSINNEGTAPWKLDYIYNDKFYEYSSSKDSSIFVLNNGYYKFIKTSDKHCFTDLNSNSYIHIHTKITEGKPTKKQKKKHSEKPKQSILKLVDIYSYNPEYLSLEHKQITIELSESNKTIQTDSTSYILSKNTGIYGPKTICDQSDIRYWTNPIPKMQYQWDVKNGSVKKGKKSFSSIISFDNKQSDAEVILKKRNSTKISDTTLNKLEVNFYKHKAIELDTLFDFCEKNLKITIKNYNPKSSYYWKINSYDKYTRFDKENALISISKAGNYTITIKEKCNINCTGYTKTIEFIAPEISELQFNIPHVTYTGVEFPITFDYSKVDKIKYLGDITNIAQFFEVRTPFFHSPKFRNS